MIRGFHIKKRGGEFKVNFAKLNECVFRNNELFCENNIELN